MDFMTPQLIPEEDLIACLGEDLPEGAPAVDQELVIEAIRDVFDPEIPVNIYDLGLIYTIDCLARGKVNVNMTLTAPGCPVAGEMPFMVANRLVIMPEVGEVTVKIVWDPPWTPDLMSEDAKILLGF